ncbi:MAG: hypothetical protein J6B04_05785 [Clostridia bacterium]|nr:hypothetical protein [Clostridia bacterium]
MGIADYVILAIAVIFAIIGLIAGFGKGLKFFTSGIFGFIFSIVVCVFIFEYVKTFGAVVQLLDKLMELINNATANNQSINNLLITVLPTADIILGVALFIVVQLARIIVVAIIKRIFEINNGFFRFINKVFGMVLMVAIALMVILLVLNYIPEIEKVLPDLMAQLKAQIENSVILKWLYENNPLQPLLQAVVQ